MTAREQAIKAAAEAVVLQGRGDKDTLHVGRLRAEAALAAAVPVLLNDLADRADKLRRELCEDGWMGHSTDPDSCSTCDRFVALVRAAAKGWGQ